MSTEGTAFRSFEELAVCQAAPRFSQTIGGFSRRRPDSEKFELASQIRRASVSLTRAIAEGHGRYHFADQIRSQLQARSWLEALLDDLNVCLDEDSVPAPEVEDLKQPGWHLLGLINGSRRYLRNRSAPDGALLRQAPAPYAASPDPDVLSDAAPTCLLPFNGSPFQPI